jgi:hypothetical protein
VCKSEQRCFSYDQIAAAIYSREQKCGGKVPMKIMGPKMVTIKHLLDSEHRTSIGDRKRAAKDVAIAEKLQTRPTGEK